MNGHLAGPPLGMGPSISVPWAQGFGHGPTLDPFWRSRGHVPVLCRVVSFEQGMLHYVFGSIGGFWFGVVPALRTVGATKDSRAGETPFT